MYDNNPYNNNPHNNPYNNSNPNNNNNPYNNNNSYNNNNPYNNQTPRQYPANASGDRLASAAMVMGILTVATFVSMTIYPPFIFGGIGIVLALLSKGRASRMATKAKAGIICAAIGLAANCSLCSASLYMLYTRPEIMNQVNTIFENQYGVSYDEMINMILDDEGITLP